MDLLRETHNINLAPEVLEPEAQSIEKVGHYVQGLASFPGFLTFISH